MEAELKAADEQRIAAENNAGEPLEAERSRIGGRLKAYQSDLEAIHTEYVIASAFNHEDAFTKSTILSGLKEKLAKSSSPSESNFVQTETHKANLQYLESGLHEVMKERIKLSDLIARKHEEASQLAKNAAEE